MIRFGPAGIPLSCKGRTLKDGVEDVHALSLTAMEVQMVRSETMETYPEDEAGLTMKDVRDANGSMVVALMKEGELVVDPDETIEEDDVLVRMISGITNCFGDLYSIGDMARRMDVSLSLHTPYYEDLGSYVPEYQDLGIGPQYFEGLNPDEVLTVSCINNIMYSGVVANALGAGIVSTNLGIYNPGMDEMDVEENIKDNLDMIMGWWEEKGLRPKLGIEITGRENVFGSLEQILDICDEFKGCVPVINWPNYYSRLMPQSPDTENAPSWEVDDFQYAIDQVGRYNDGKIYTQFSGIEYRNWSEYRLSPIKKGSLKFDTLAECLVNAKPDITVISSSPLLEHDAMYMRTIHERALTKKVLKRIKQERKAEAEEKKAEAEADAETEELSE